MKTNKTVPIEFVQIPKGGFIPEELEFGKLYYSSEYKTSSHLCCCGCGQQVPLPIKQGEWSLYVNTRTNKVSVTPSILQRIGCKSHYVINNGQANII